MDGQLTFKGAVICPGIGVGRVVFIDTETVVPRRTIGAAEIAGEQQRYSAAAETARLHVRDHVRATHHVMADEIREAIASTNLSAPGVSREMERGADHRCCTRGYPRSAT